MLRKQAKTALLILILTTQLNFQHEKPWLKKYVQLKSKAEERRGGTSGKSCSKQKSRKQSSIVMMPQDLGNNIL